MGGLQVPYQEADRHGVVGARLHLRAVQRGDMSNGDELPNKAGVMAVHAVRPDGSHDTYAYAPTARSVLRGGA